MAEGLEALWSPVNDETDVVAFPFSNQSATTVELKAKAVEEDTKLVTRRKHNKAGTGIVIGASSPVAGRKRKEDGVIHITTDMVHHIEAKPKRLFRFEEAWMYDPGTKETMKAA
ncbi:hypothetical protein RIF29_18759 [Crotalaria pallida]|uniref:Uncharacterized protein n=1 Tax=Crotalaria pallida TaxID=3830 RepID=A0AAN9F005_CROPI